MSMGVATERGEMYPPLPPSDAIAWKEERDGKVESKWIENPFDLKVQISLNQIDEFLFFVMVPSKCSAAYCKHAESNATDGPDRGVCGNQILFSDVAEFGVVRCPDCTFANVTPRERNVVNAARY